MTQHLFLIIGALLGFLGVAAGAFGAHLLKYRLSPEAFEVFEVAVRYQMYHALALLGLTALMGWMNSLWLISAGWLLIVGVILFSGSLYALIFFGARPWGVITPIGGLLLLLGWLSLGLGGVFAR